MNNFLGFAETEEQRTDGIFGLVRSKIDQYEHQNREDDDIDYQHQFYYNKASNEDLLNVMEDDEEDRHNMRELYDRLAKKKVTFSSNTLEFRYEDIPPIINEQPDPVIITNYRKQSRSKSGSKSGSRSRSWSAVKSVVSKKKAQKEKINRAKKFSWKANKGKSYKVKNKTINSENRPTWSSNNTTTGFFGNIKDMKSKRPLEEAPTIHKGTGMKVMQEHHGGGKFSIDFLNDKGNKTGTLKMHKDIASLNEEYENKHLNSMKVSWTGLSNKVKGKTSRSRSASKPKIRSVSRQERETNTALGAVYSSNFSKKGDDKTRQIEKQVADNFKEKENLINLLNKELQQERERRKLLDKEFKNQFNQFEKELKTVQKISERARSRPDAKDLAHESLDMIPTKDKPIPKNKATNMKVHKPTPYKSTFGKPISHTSKYKNVQSKLKEHMKMPESYKQYQQEKQTKEKETKLIEKLTPQLRSPTKVNFTPEKSSPGKSSKTQIQSKSKPIDRKSMIAEQIRKGRFQPNSQDLSFIQT